MKKRKLFFNAIIIVFYIPLLLSCNFGDSSENDQSDPRYPKCVSSKKFSKVTIDSKNFIPYYQIDKVETETSENNILYLGTDRYIIEFDRETGEKRILVDNALETGRVNHPKNLIKYGDSLYFSIGTNIQKVFLGDDGKSSIDLIMSKAPFKVDTQGFWKVNSYYAACNEEKVFYIVWNQIENGKYIYHVYSKNINDDTPPKLIFTYNDSIKVCANEKYLFISTSKQYPETNTIYIYNIDEGSIDSIQNISTLYGSNPFVTMTSTSSYFYWVNGLDMYRMYLSTGEVELIFSGISSDLVVTDDFKLYTSENGHLYEIDLANKTQIEIKVSYFKNCYIKNGELFWLGSNGVYKLNSDYTSTTLAINENGNSNSFNDILAVSQNLILIKSNIGSYLYNFNDNSLCKANKIFNSVSCSNSTGFFNVRDDQGIKRIPVSSDFRSSALVYRDTLSSSVRIDKMVIKDEWIYYITDENCLSKVRIDGSSHQVLSKVDDWCSSLRSFFIYNDRIYFTRKYCTDEKRKLLSIPLNGGEEKIENELGARADYLIEKDGILYFIDQEIIEYIDGFVDESTAIYAIKLDDNSMTKLVSELPYCFSSDSFLGDYFLGISSGYLYYRFQSFDEESTRWDSSWVVRRNKIITWDQVDNPEVLIDKDEPNSLMYHMSDVNDLYYWNVQGFKYIEQ